MIGPIDYDFRIFNRYKEVPWKWASYNTDMITNEVDYQKLMDMFIDNYQELSSIPYLKERLEVYKIIDLLNEYINTKDSDILEKVNYIIEEGEINYGINNEKNIREI